MREYLMNIIGAVLISVFCDVLLPDKWSKYVKTITGLVIMAAIISPLGNFEIPDMSEFVRESQNIETKGIDTRNKMIVNELEKNIENDISERFLAEFNIDIKAEAVIQINADNEITGVKSITLRGGNITAQMIERIREIYAPTEVFINEN